MWDHLSIETLDLRDDLFDMLNNIEEDFGSCQSPIDNDAIENFSNIRSGQATAEVQQTDVNNMLHDLPPPPPLRQPANIDLFARNETPHSKPRFFHPQNKESSEETNINRNNLN